MLSNKDLAVVSAVLAVLGVAAFILLARFQAPLELSPGQLSQDYVGRLVSVSGVARSYSKSGSQARFSVCADVCASVRLSNALAGQISPIASGSRITVTGLVRSSSVDFVFVQPLGVSSISFV